MESLIFVIHLSLREEVIYTLTQRRSGETQHCALMKLDIG